MSTWGFFYFLDITNIATTQNLCTTRIAESYTLHLAFWELPDFFKEVISFYILPLYEGYCFLPTTVIICLLWNSSFSGGEVVCYCNFNHVSLINDVERIFMWLLAIYALCLLWRNVYSDSLSVFSKWDYLLHWMAMVLGVSPLTIKWFANIFPHSMGCFYTLLMVFFEIHKFLILMKCNLFFILLFMFLVLCISRPCLNQGHQM